MTKFRTWTERLVAADGVLPDVLYYTRRATPGREHAPSSHEQQKSEIHAQVGEFDERWWFADTCSGASLEREQLAQLREFCRLHPRDKSNPGRVHMCDPSRLGRHLDEEGRPDLHASLAVHKEFESAGWKLRFVTVSTAGGGPLTNIVTKALLAYASKVCPPTQVNALESANGDAE
jgi:DNA invertase Pin-like site-specific DNA recombinase